MKKYLYVCLALACCVVVSSCNSKQSSEADTSDSIFVEIIDSNQQILLFGHIVSLDSASIREGLVEIANEVDEIEYDVQNWNITLCNATFHVNVFGNTLVLWSSVQPYSLQMESVRNLISRYYGESVRNLIPRYYGEVVYTWPNAMDETKKSSYNPSIKMMRGHTEEGGTLIFIEKGQWHSSR